MPTTSVLEFASDSIITGTVSGDRGKRGIEPTHAEGLIGRHGPRGMTADRDVLASVRAGDEAIFAALVREWSPAMVRLAGQFVSTSQSAEDSVQDAWLGMLNGLDRFQGPDGRYPGGWTREGVPQSWHQPETRVIAGETLSLVEQALEHLPARQRLVVTMRDVQGFGADEVCDLLEISPGNQRILLHRGRATLRAAPEEYYRV